ncbi:MAG: glycosyltransferase family 4 protein [Candidatus Levybacteria bacterium]|nr:glycosyltransferase family 4 protein [Candidatus Levybacteria bacterium]
MRIGIDARLWDESGVGRYIRNLVYNLQIIDKRNEYILFALNKDIQNSKFKNQNSKFRLVRADIRWHTIEEQLRFPPVLNKEKLDLVHFPYFSVPIFYNKPFIVTIHDLILHHFPTGEASTLPLPLYQLKLLGYKFVIGQAARKAAKVITVSNATKQEIVDHLRVDSEKIVVTYEGTNINSKFKIQNSKFKITNKKYFLYVGNAYPHKNLGRLIQAFDQIRSQEPEAKLILVGREDYFYKRLKEKVKATKLQDSVLFYGEASDEELAGLYKNALALIMPSLMEGFGLPALEAMANKCLVLASDIPALKEICKDVALYFNPYDIDEIVERMRNVCFNDLNHFSKNIEKGLERARRFSWEKMARETLTVYASCSSAGSG